MRRALYLLPVLGLTLALAPAARADLQYTLDPTHVAGSTTFVYDLSFQNTVVDGVPAQRLDPYTGSVPGPAVVPASPNTGSFATIYDIPGFVSATLTGPSAGLFAISTQAAGVTPSGVVPPDSGLTNVTLYYTGPRTTTPQPFNNVLTIVVSSGNTALNDAGNFTGRVTKNVAPAADTPVDNIGFVTIPAAVPEPSSVVLLGLGGLAVVGAGLRRRFARA